MSHAQKPTYCPECGGEMVYSIGTKKNSCKSCGLTLSAQELMELREKNRPNDKTGDEEKKTQKREYLKWYLRKK
jgi:hypothetical protein